MLSAAPLPAVTENMACPALPLASYPAMLTLLMAALKLLASVFRLESMLAILPSRA